MRHIVFGDDEEAGCFLIQTMHDSRARISARVGKLLEMKNQAVNESGACRSGPGMYHQSCRLLNDGDVLVLKIDLERDLLRCERRRGRDGIEIDLDRFAAADTVPGLIRMTFDADGAGTVQELNLRSGQVFDAPGEKDVETEPTVLRAGLELHFG